MIPSSDFPITPDSPGVSPGGLRDAEKPTWKPEGDRPKLLITVSDEGASFIEELVVPALGVARVRVVVKDENGNAVVSEKIIISMTYWITYIQYSESSYYV